LAEEQQRVCQGEGSGSFLKKRTKKLFPGASHAALGFYACEAPGRGFLLLFFKKEALAFP
jgi:hypothetical protein